MIYDLHLGSRANPDQLWGCGGHDDVTHDTSRTGACFANACIRALKEALCVVKGVAGFLPTGISTVSFSFRAPQNKNN